MKRPVIVTVMGVLLLLGSLVQLGTGALVIAKHNDADLLSEANISTSHATIIGIVLLVFGLFSFVLAVGLFRGSRGARNLIGLGQLLQIGGGIYAAVKLTGDHRSSAIGSIGGAVVVLYMLFGTEKAKEYFAN